MSNLIWIILHPEFWIQNYAYSEVTDNILNKCMQENWDVKFWYHYIEITDKNNKSFKVWNSNYPYASYSIEIPGIYSSNSLAKRKTRFLFKQWLERKALESL